MGAPGRGDRRPSGDITLALLECRSHPLRHGDQEALAGFDSFFASKNLIMLDIGSDVIDLATELRVRYNLRSPDAIHMATAILIGADAS